METANVSGCTAEDCAYNREGDCRAAAITVGNGLGPSCDTFMPRSEEGAAECVLESEAGVGACKMSDCRHNDCLQCGAGEVSVTLGSIGAMCGTYDRA